MLKRATPEHDFHFVDSLFVIFEEIRNQGNLITYIQPC